MLYLLPLPSPVSSNPILSSFPPASASLLPIPRSMLFFIAIISFSLAMSNRMSSIQPPFIKLIFIGLILRPSTFHGPSSSPTGFSKRMSFSQSKTSIPNMLLSTSTPPEFTSFHVFTLPSSSRVRSNLLVISSK
ncbi:hypothetical protein AX774_g6414 [Zancudomyces culisetae]|uniref:Uncharacterized protein n=1 Tax=Zancudomyces culisetae TaxID=1213189 RepID=A0A1R1PF30_ZANCU|nr:hypothetical protein AX774_g7581 [Zancudomyces culisetae]OMH79584.1 hypothetical protein AX774_g6999 [Zancudomyces culisetae]OMH80155.1 hypothetical protein AX774_g6414 [Zancudomyces culisetae]|eukprot:OMH79008.1 hypothetical protein AX774_g7581 [Zancudomyces culisetae]